MTERKRSLDEFWLRRMKSLKNHRAMWRNHGKLGQR
jgi:hypothetical protein